MSWFKRPNPNSNTVPLDDALKNSELKIMTNFFTLIPIVMALFFSAVFSTALFILFKMLTNDNIFAFGAIVSFSTSIGIALTLNIYSKH